MSITIYSAQATSQIYSINDRFYMARVVNGTLCPDLTGYGTLYEAMKAQSNHNVQAEQANEQADIETSVRQ